MSVNEGVNKAAEGPAGSSNDGVVAGMSTAGDVGGPARSSGTSVLER